MSELTFKDWMEVASAVATAGGLLYLMYGDYFKRPVLDISFTPSRDISEQHNTPSFTPDQYWERSIWVRVCVVNRRGRRVAKNARAYLLGAVPTTRLPGFRNDSRPLPWQNDYHDPKSRDLHPGVENRIDVLVLPIGLTGGVLTCARPDCVLHIGEYYLAIQVTADDAEPVVIYLSYRYDGSGLRSLKVIEASPGTWPG